MKTRRGRWPLVPLALVAGLGVDLVLLVREAQAIIGRPLTPMSYAGVARRTTRRTVAVGAAVGAAAYTPPPPPPPPYPYYW